MKIGHSSAIRVKQMHESTSPYKYINKYWRFSVLNEAVFDIIDNENNKNRKTSLGKFIEVVKEMSDATISHFNVRIHYMNCYKIMKSFK